MKPIDLDAPHPPEAHPDESIHVARLPRTDEAGSPFGPQTAAAIAFRPVAPRIAAPTPAAAPPPLVMVIEQTRRARTRTVVAPLLLLVLVACLWLLIGSATSGSPTRSHKAPIRLTVSQQRAAAAAHARAAAIAQARRDRGTDAALQDTIPAPAPRTTPATPKRATPPAP